MPVVTARPDPLFSPAPEAPGALPPEPNISLPDRLVRLTRVLAVGSLLVWLYFTEGIVRATSSSGLVVPLAWAQVLLCVLLFAACAMHVRHRLRQAKARASEAASPPTPA